MKKVALLLLLVLAACSASEEIPEPETNFVPDVPEEVEEPIVLEPEEELDEEESLEDEEFYAIPDDPLTAVTCEGDALTFTITNTLNTTWSLELLSFPPPQDKEQLKITINSYDPWTPGRYFGEQSLRDCTDALIEPGETVTCTVNPIPLVTPNAYSKNTIQVQAIQINEQEQFTC